MAKKSKNKGAGAKRKELDEPIVTMKALQEMSDSDDEELPPESEWNKDAKALKETIERGTFDVLLKQSAVGGGSDEESFEEVDLDDGDYDESSNGSVEEEAETANDSSAAKTSKKDEEIEMADDNDADDSAGPSDQEEEASGDERAASEGEEEYDEGAASEGEEDDDEEDEDEESENDEEDEKSSTIKEKNTVKAKALQVVAEALIAEKKQWPWAETFDIIPVDTPLPFHGDDALNIHDDLKREVAFYDMALQAVLEAKEKCKEAGVPFSRPEDFFAEMVKTDGKTPLRQWLLWIEFFPVI
jgi:rRNA-processing protein EBP2